MPNLPQLGSRENTWWLELGTWGLARRNLKEKHGAPCALRTSALWFRWRSAVELHPGLQSISLSSLIEPSMNQEGTFAALSTFQWLTPRWDGRIDLLSAHSSPFFILTLLCLHIYSPFYPLQIYSSLYLSSLFGRPSNFRLAVGFFSYFIWIIITISSSLPSPVISPLPSLPFLSSDSSR